MRKFYAHALALSCLALCSVTLMAQEKSVRIGISTHFINFKTDEYFKGENWQENWGPSKVTVGVPITDRIMILPTGSVGRLVVPNQDGSQKNFWNLDVNGAYILSPTRIEPYVMAGMGIGHLNKKNYAVANVGLGLNIWLTNGWALNAQTNYNSPFGIDNFWQNSIGMIFRDGGPRDSDKDGIPDDTDACPKQKGSPTTQGCPDADGDGVKDTDDACPNEAGTAATKGCPDSDGDGIANAQDNCPNEAGKPENGGCPDSDGDGILDKDDACPREKGIAQFNGCPDSDGDGVQDKDDACPSEKGTAANKGCPDRDGDGIIDKNDTCPDTPGIAANNGCPEIKKEEVETKLNVAAKQIQFESGKTVIKQSSFDDLDQIVAIMNQYSWTRFKIEGHTDNTGNAVTNKTLSDG
ncbi:MAG: thrombospondin type 3 repeat-containing protein, partial [Cyclobacteriaceae bacterium]|nr:thrombospondin type 3 repeat-containing protein [Cyclobacteriaceae bacterium]